MSATLTSGKNVAVLGAEVANTDAAVFIDNVHIYGEVTVTNTSTALYRVGGFGGYVCDVTVQNSSFTGKLNATGTGTTVRCGMGGIIAENEGPTKGRQSVIKNCQVNADLTASYSGSCTGQHTSQCTVGGIVGRAITSVTFVEGCTVKGSLSSMLKETTPYGCVGGIIGSACANKQVSGYSNSILVVATDCDVTGITALQGSFKGDIYGVKDAGALKERIYVSDCTPDTQNTPARDFGDFGEVDGKAFDANCDYVWLIDEKDDLSKIGKADTTKTDYTYAVDGFYRVDEDLSLGSYSNYVVTGHFGGVFDGNGKTLNISGMTHSFFQRLSDGYSANNKTNDTVIMDLDLGSSEAYINMTTSAKNGGVLGAYSGDVNINYRLLVNNVNIYANITNSCAQDSYLGGFVGTSRHAGFYDCNMYGSITSKNINKTADETCIGGFVGNADQAKARNVFSNCNNFANIYVSEVGISNAIARVGGFIGDVTRTDANMVGFYNSNNFGDINVVGTANNKEVNVGGFAGSINAVGVAAAVDCANFGDISSTQYASGFISASANPISLSSFIQAGTVTATTKAEDHNVASGTATVSTLNCATVKNLITMDNGAAVRLAEDTGLRFTANVSTDVIARLEATLGDELTVSYGMLIAPDAFIGNGEFTREALDEYAEAEGFEGAAYVDVPSVDEQGKNVWFREQVGKLAGSITGLPATLYKTNFSGVAYITIKVGDSVIYTAYAPNAQTRNIYEVAKAALDDTMTEIATVDGYTYDEAIEVGETYYVDGVAKVFAEGDAAVYSCYPKSQRDTLNKIVADADTVVAE